MSRRYFGTDGIRGRANQHPMTVEVATRLGKAVALHFAREGHAPQVLIGKDPRRSSYMFELALAAGINAMGGDVLFTGPLPTPGIARLTTGMRCDAGIVISASHNPHFDNGIKIFGADGYKLPDETELQLESLLEDEARLHENLSSERIGRSRRIDDATGRYIVFLKNTFPRSLSLEGLRIVVDCANGASYKVAPTVLAELGAEVISTGTEPNGYNINDKRGSLFPEHCAELVYERRADIGISLDGDADRCIFIDEKSQVVNGDQVMALTALSLKKRGLLRKNTVVGTVMSNLGLTRALKAHGIELVRTKVGDRYVVEEMRKHDFSFGGEQSGHLVFLDHSTTGDGMIAALQVLASMQRTGKPLSELAQVMKRVPQVLTNVVVREKPPLEQLTEVSELIQSVNTALGEDGRVLVRYSGTEPKCRVMLEGLDEHRIHAYAEDIAAAIHKAIGA